MALDFTELEAELTRDHEVKSSASTLIRTLADLVEATKGDPGKLAAVVAKMRAQSDTLAAAVAAGTPGEAPADPGVR